jgi:glycosyltransferase involved in cell wall biosynthesis
MMLSDNTYPPDIRVKKESKALIEAGHNIFLISRKRNTQKKYETVDGIQIQRVNFPFLNNHIFGWEIYKFIFRYIIFLNALLSAKKNKIDAIHVHDLPFAYASCLIGKLLKKPVVLDFHEDYTDMVKWSIKYQKGLRKIVNSIFLHFLSWEEKFAIKNSDRLIVIVEEEKNRRIKDGYPADKITVVQNTADIAELSNIQNQNNPYEKDDKFIISYTGGFSRHRGLDTLIDSMPQILKSISNTQLLLIGDGDKHLKNEIHEKCSKLKIEDHVTFTGWVPFNEYINYMNISDICTIPYHKTPQTDKSFPHKLSQFMYLEKPILVSNVNSLKRIIEDTECGIIFEAGNSEDLAKKVINAKENKNLKVLGENGKKAAITTYNWKNTSEQLVKLYSELK